MRKFRNLSKSKQEELNKLFPDIEQLIACEESELYKHLSISVFDHWLTTEEAKEKIDNVSKKEEQLRDIQFHGFCEALAESEECYLIKLRGKGKKEVTYREFTSDISRKEVLKPQPYLASNNCRFILALPSSEAVYFEGWDFTHHVYFKNREKLSGVLSLVKENGLCIIE